MWSARRRNKFYVILLRESKKMEWFTDRGGPIKLCIVEI